MAEPVPDYVSRTIQDACDKVELLAAKLLEAKRGVNTICHMYGIEPHYQGLDEPEKQTRNTASNGRPDRYMGKALATVVRTILNARHEVDVGPATVDELYAEMVSGNFDFEGKSEENSKRALAVSLSKNATVFKKLSDQSWGLAEWYGIRPRKSKPDTSQPSEKQQEFKSLEDSETADVESDTQEIDDLEEKEAPVKPR